MLLACVDGGLCILAAALVSTGVSTLLVSLGLRKPNCDPHCPEHPEKVKPDGHKNKCSWKPDWGVCDSECSEDPK